MKYYLAPLEGITTQVYRNAYHKYFRPMDKYFTPFLVPHTKKGFSTKEIREIHPDNNKGLYVVPQILSNQAEDTVNTIHKLEQYGYKEVNLNLGCPSKTVVSKNRGAGFLSMPEELDHFLEGIFEKTEVKVSVKTRIGRDEPEEFYRLMDIYNKYPLEELIVHPRTQKDFYRNTPNLSMFGYAVEHSSCTLCYNGDVKSREDKEKIFEKFPEVPALMLGRGVIANPFLVTLIEGSKNGNVIDKETLQNFHDALYEGYGQISEGILPVLFKMKEIWTYMKDLFPEDKKRIKKLKKAENAKDYEQAAAELFALL